MKRKILLKETLAILVLLMIVLSTSIIQPVHAIAGSSFRYSYAKQSVNVRNAPNGSIVGTLPAGAEIEAHGIKDNWIQFEYIGEEAYAYAPFFQNEPVPFKAYIKAGYRIRRSPDGEIIDTATLPLYIEGVNQKNWIRFTYQGQTAYVHQVAVQMESPYYMAYVKNRINVRQSPEGKIIGSLPGGTQIRGRLEGDWVRFTNIENLSGYVYAPLLQKDPVLVSRYVKKGFNLRTSPNGKLITNLKNPIYAQGSFSGDWFNFEYNGQKACVHKNALQTSSPSIVGYASSGLNVRILPNGFSVGTLEKGVRIEGVLEGNWVRFQEQGQEFYVYAPLLLPDSIPLNIYIMPGYNIRKSPNGKIISSFEYPFYVRGTYVGDYFKFQYQGQTAYVHIAALNKYPTNIQLYAKDNLNVRDSVNGKIIGRIKKGNPVNVYFPENKGNWAVTRQFMPLKDAPYSYFGGYVYCPLLTYKEQSENISAKGQIIITEAKKHLGKEYVFATQGPDTFDCSGYVWYVYNHSGVKKFPRTSAEYIYKNYCEPVSFDKLEIGDLIFFANTYDQSLEIDHVAIYIGNYQMIHAAEDVNITDMRPWTPHLYGYGRVK